MLAGLLMIWLLAALNPMCLASLFLVFILLLPSILAGEIPTFSDVLVVGALAIVIPLSAYAAVSVLYRWCFRSSRESWSRAGSLLAGVFVLYAVVSDEQALASLYQTAATGGADVSLVVKVVGRICMWGVLSVSVVMLSTLSIELPLAWATTGIGGNSLDGVRDVVRWSAVTLVLWFGWYLIVELFTEQLSL
jgi:hypothetical protein